MSRGFGNDTWVPGDPLDNAPPKSNRPRVIDAARLAESLALMQRTNELIGEPVKAPAHPAPTQREDGHRRAQADRDDDEWERTLAGEAPAEDDPGPPDADKDTVRRDDGGSEQGHTDPDAIPSTVAAVRKAHALLGRFAGMDAMVPPARVVDEIVALLYRAANPDGKDGAVPLRRAPEYPTKWLPPVMQAQLDAIGALPMAAVAGALLGCGSAASMMSRLVIDDTRRVVPTLWIPSIGDAGSGKTPAADLAWKPYRSHAERAALRYVAEMKAWKDLDPRDRRIMPKPVNSSKLSEDTTVEMLARKLNGNGECIALVPDELTTVLDGIGQYKQRGGGVGSDKARFLALWSGKSWTYERVGKDDDPLFIHIANPVMPVFGTIQPEFVSRLGDAASDMQPRWLPHWSEGLSGTETGRTAFEWEAALRVLLHDLERPRAWGMPRDCDARRELLAAEERWATERADITQTAASTSFLAKGGEHAARIALVLAEVCAAGEAASRGESKVTTGVIPLWAVRAAVEVVDYCAAVWRMLPDTQAPLSRSWAEARIAEKDGVLNAWLRKHGGQATKREIQRAGVAGAKTMDDAQALVDRHVAVYGEDAAVLGSRGSIVVYAR
ncbi:DUF3987 domain-containing protein [Dactylosporangium sp. CA-152071]|uniref:DUF3987 domain-containing protein n=1 Tax=Dactylosporangium sp. CA-152071 TaxID=3239933 RepID=UPI003D931B50